MHQVREIAGLPVRVAGPVELHEYLVEQAPQPHMAVDIGPGSGLTAADCWRYGRAPVGLGVGIQEIETDS